MKICAISMLLALMALSGCVMSGTSSSRHSGINALRLRQENSTAAKVMKCMARIPLGVISLGFSESNFTAHRQCEKFLGKSEADLYMSFGPPSSRIHDVTNGDYILSYCKETRLAAPGTFVAAWSPGNLAAAYVPPIESRTFYMKSFRVTSSGRVIEYRWHCESE